MIKTLIFDLDGVYYKKDKENSFFEWLKEFDIPEELIIEGWFKGDLRTKFQKGEVSAVEFWDTTMKKWGLKGDRSDIIYEITRGDEIDEDLEKLIAQQQKLGCKIGICSNTNESIIDSIQMRGHQPKNIDFAVLSYQHGVIKPSKEIFELVLKYADCLPEEIAYFDDNSEALSGALELGIKAYTYTSVEDVRKALAENS